MLKELTKVEQRYQAVMAVQVDALEVVVVAQKFGGVSPDGARLAAPLRARRAGRPGRMSCHPPPLRLTYGYR